MQRCGWWKLFLFMVKRSKNQSTAAKASRKPQVTEGTSGKKSNPGSPKESRNKETRCNHASGDLEERDEASRYSLPLSQVLSPTVKGAQVLPEHSGPPSPPVCSPVTGTDKSSLMGRPNSGAQFSGDALMHANFGPPSPPVCSPTSADDEKLRMQAQCPAGLTEGHLVSDALKQMNLNFAAFAQPDRSVLQGNWDTGFNQVRLEVQDGVVFGEWSSKPLRGQHCADEEGEYMQRVTLGTLPLTDAQVEFKDSTTLRWGNGQLWRKLQS